MFREILRGLSVQIKKNVGRNNFSDEFRKIIIHYKITGYNMNVMRETACLAVNPIKVNNFATLYNFTSAAA